MAKIMSCGCANNGYFREIDDSLTPACTEHKAVIPMLKQPDLSKRLAKCTNGCLSTIVPSRADLQFFKYKPNKPYDEYYCGCGSMD